MEEVVEQLSERQLRPCGEVVAMVMAAAPLVELGLKE